MGKSSFISNLANTKPTVTADTVTGFNSGGVADGTVIYFKGRDAIGDSGGGVFVFSTTNKTPNGGTVFSPTGGGSLQRQDVSMVTPQMFGGVANGSTDCYVPIQTAIDYLASVGGGTLLFTRGVYICNTPISLPSGVRILGEGRECTIIRKNSSTTKSVIIYSGALVVYEGNPLPSNINAVLVLVGSGGRYKGGVSHITLEGTLSTPGNYESHNVDFGIVSVGSVSDFDLCETYINMVKYGAILPTIFASKIENNRISDCLQAMGIDDGTSLLYVSNYSNNCRSGHFIRGVKYSQISNNACDYTNDPGRYPNRARLCFAYRLRSLVGCTFESNGDEQTWGRSVWLETLDNCTVKNHVTIGVGSDYVGTEHIAVIYSDGVLRNTSVVNNLGYDVKTQGLIYGGADSAKHHNIYCETTAYILKSVFTGNMVRDTVSGIPTDAGYGNHVPSNWLNINTGGDSITITNPTLTANTVGDLSITYGSANKHYQHEVGNLYHVFGCFDVGIGYTTAGSYLIFQGFSANQNIPWRIQITGVEGGSSLTKKLASFVLNANQGNGITFDENEGIVYITDIPSGSNIKIYYDGWYAKA